MSERSGETFSEGDHVRHHPTGAENVSEGEIKRIIAEPEAVGGHQSIKASERRYSLCSKKNSDDYSRLISM